MPTAVAEALPRVCDVDDVKNVGKSPDSTTFCKKEVPSLFSSFVDAFVDYAVGGQFLGGNNAGGGASPSPSPSSPEEEEAMFLSSLQSKSGAKVGLDADIMASDWGDVGGGGLRTWLPAPERLIAVGDIHGDIAKARAALRIANVIDENDEWVGGETVVVQVCEKHLFLTYPFLFCVHVLEKVERPSVWITKVSNPNCKLVLI